MASGRPSHAVLGGSLEPEVILPKLPGWVLSPSLLPESQQISLLIPMLPFIPLSNKYLLSERYVPGPKATL